MIDKKKLLIAKAQGFAIAFGRMGKEERAQYPSDTYAKDYNALHAAVIALLPDLEPVMPPAVELVEGMVSSIQVSSQSIRSPSGWWCSEAKAAVTAEPYVTRGC